MAEVEQQFATPARTASVQTGRYELENKRESGGVSGAVLASVLRHQLSSLAGQSMKLPSNPEFVAHRIIRTAPQDLGSRTTHLFSALRVIVRGLIAESGQPVASAGSGSYSEVTPRHRVRAISRL